MCATLCLALASTVLGHALILGSCRLLRYVAVMAPPVYTFVRSNEEPALERTFGEPYERYCANVPRWLPRLRPWDEVQCPGSTRRADGVHPFASTYRCWQTQRHRIKLVPETRCDE
jgi:hypothetical protein